MPTNDERYALVMGNSFPEFQFKPKVLDTLNWTPSRSIPCADSDDERSEDYRPRQSKASVEAAPSPPIQVVFHNQLASDDLHVFYTKLGGRKIVDFLVRPGNETPKHVCGSAPSWSSSSGVHFVSFPFHAATMLSPSFAFPVPATSRPTSALVMTFSVHHSRFDTYELFAVDPRGRLAPLSVLDHSSTHDTFADHPFVVWCRGSGRGFCIYAQEAAAVAKVKYSLVVDDNVPSVSFMATSKPMCVSATTAAASVCVSFYPRQ
ncbi:hypothetical protein DYB37_006989 [Aphanomyces astaci]|uniref:Uncharacterized protein n=1 Tax=Aphanomyces astaci TaxID=112090 RepID=A0A397FA41_APHAT|nr:hypothetical protein DYB30_004301 [Aphanomyces astaci]RHY94284.1 hypothetical protein DYB35_003751 [Aphanomyces astaci]RHZ12553.1 hypothetical protein DYB37_006989 [Aphanomyces astaci]RHZ21912.1 hypothetical protein DYB31_015923 [Aphanomyces astaci]